MSTFAFDLIVTVLVLAVALGACIGIIYWIGKIARRGICKFTLQHLQPVIDLFEKQKYHLTEGDMRMTISPESKKWWSFLANETGVRVTLEAPALSTDSNTMCLLSFYHRKPLLFQELVSEGKLPLPEGWVKGPDKKYPGMHCSEVYVSASTDTTDLFQYLVNALAILAEFPQNGVFVAQTKFTRVD